MKKKFSKILGIGLAVVLVLTLGLVTAVPVAADSPADTDVGFLFELGHSSDKAEWSTTMAGETGAMGAYSVMLDKSANAGTTYIQFIPVPGTKVSDLATIGDTNFWYWYDFGTSGGPGIELQFTMPDYDPDTGYGRVDVSVQAGAYGADNPSGVLLLNQWANENTIINNTAFYWGWDPVDGEVFHMDPGDGDYERATLSDMLDLIDAEAEMDGASAADWELTRVRIEFYGATARTCYIDDITIDGTLYELEPIFLDAEFYSVADTIEVTVPNFAANTDSVRINPVAAQILEGVPKATWTVTAKSSSDPLTEITVALEETGANTGVFTASFGTSGTPPVAEDEVYVEDGATITVTYDASVDPYWGAGESPPVTSIDVLVDDTAPTIDDELTVEGVAVTPTDGTIIYSTEPVIVATYSDATSGIDTTSVAMTVNGVNVTSSATVEEGSVSYTPGAGDLAAGDTVEVTVDVSDMAGNAAETASWTFTIASAFNVTVDKTEIPAATATNVKVTFADVAGLGVPDGLLDTVKVTLTGPGVDLASGDFDGNEGTKGEAIAFGATSLTFSVTPEQAGTITVTVEGTFDAVGDPLTVVIIEEELTVDVTGYLIEETWLDVGMDTTGDISLRVTTEAGVAVNTGIVTITAAEADGFEKDVDPLVAGDEPFQVIVINGATGEITYDDDDAEDFLVSDGNYEVTGITFANIGDVDILVQDAGGENDKAHFTIAFSVLGINVYTLTTFEPASLTAGVDHESLDITVTEADAPVTDVATITIGTTDYTGDDLTSVDNVYTVDPELVSEVATLDVMAKNEAGTKYGTATLEVVLPTLTAVITETVDTTEVERNCMLVGAAYDYTIAITALDAVGEPLALGQVWLGTYDADEETFTALATANPAAEMPLVLDADGLGDLDIAQISEGLLSAGTLVWKVGDDGAAVGTAALLSTPTIAVEAPEYTLDWTPEAPIVDGEITFTVTDNYGDAAGNIPIIIVTPGGDPIEKVTTPDGVFKYTPTEAGDYYVSVGEQDPVTVPVVVTPLVSIAASPESVPLIVDGTQQLTIMATYEDETELDVTADATYVSSDESVATVSDAGLITAVAEGAATITVSYTEGVITKTADVLVTVTPVRVLVSIAASPLSVSLNVDGTRQLAITATYSDASTAVVTVDATYESDAESVATVSDAGLITAVADGVATITVSYTEGVITETTDVLVTVGVPIIVLYEGANPIYYTGATMDLPGALTNISEITEIIWQRDVSTAGEWWYYLVVLDYGQITQLENGRVYIIVVSEDCIWELSQ